MTYTVRKFGKAPLNIPTPQAADYPVDSTIDTAEALDNVETVIDTSADPTTALPAGTRILINSEYMTVSSASATDITVVRENPVTHLTGQDIYKMVAGRCVLWYPGQKDAYGSTIRDMSGYGNNGTLTGATWVKNSRGLWVNSFDGLDDKITCGQGASLDFTGAFTLMAWVYHTLEPGSDYQWISGKVKSDGSALAYCLQVTNAGNVVFVWRKATADQAITATDAMTRNVWHFITGVYDGAANNLYVDAASAAAPVAANGVVDTVAATNFNIGYSWSGDPNPWTGRIALTRAFNRALTAGEIATIYRNERGLFGV